MSSLSLIKWTMMLDDQQRRLHRHQFGERPRRRQLLANSEPTCFSPATGAVSSRSLAALKVTRKYRQAAVRRREYRKLKAIVPAVSTQHAVSKLTIIEEAIKYIDKLHSTLMTRFHSSLNDDDVHNQPAPGTSCSGGCHANPDSFIRQLCFDSFHARHPASSDDAISAGPGSGSGEMGAGLELRRLPLVDRQLVSRDQP